jgi:hypothetical protein
MKKITKKNTLQTKVKQAEDVIADMLNFLTKLKYNEYSDLAMRYILDNSSYINENGWDKKSRDEMWGIIEEDVHYSNEVWAKLLSVSCRNQNVAKHILKVVNETVPFKKYKNEVNKIALKSFKNAQKAKKVK